ncbi:hypothetical protein CMUS01_15162 [Colletotrichum musicola]|uniref:Uncharacterized protein n=1 Tax=Colletotrichum musicola TaxID=2175873 RepID=A0A8H6IZB1_9PEZI|nr:hypothetical protein CMUS01_15162 [Colletotrichum musicola]
MLVVESKDPRPIIRNLGKLLKPGGSSAMGRARHHQHFHQEDGRGPADGTIWTVKLADFAAEEGFVDVKINFVGGGLELARAFSDQHLQTAGKAWMSRMKQSSLPGLTCGQHHRYHHRRSSRNTSANYLSVRDTDTYKLLWHKVKFLINMENIEGLYVDYTQGGNVTQEPPFPSLDPGRPADRFPSSAQYYNVFRREEEGETEGEAEAERHRRTGYIVVASNATGAVDGTLIYATCNFAPES